MAPAPGLTLTCSSEELAGLNRRDFLRALAQAGVDVFVLDEESLERELDQARREGNP